MKEILLAYASMSGNTEAIADLIEEELVKHGLHVKRAEVYDIDASDLVSAESIIFGAYTWGDGELPDDFLDLYDEMDDIDLSQKQMAVFGSGDSSYDVFCGAVDLIEEKIKRRNGNIAVPGLKIELSPFGEDVEKCKVFAKGFAEVVAKSAPS
ncbi:MULTISPECIES: flavodoxin [Priestia]|jgi:flavodoxin I|uniref:Flavodoxin n=2 Tax=Priestia TaxID=2800373 RepID=D5DUJ3_PRIM1|nr:MULTISPECIES: flavodoxin [Priestia]AVX10747.1 flavodoxin [Bacillus sp. Y-01]KOP76813.1 flavodoxin [Bacillus sp. FJAT-21351]KQU14244.1 flavodoxin [Bacillus sp. Leaf75]MBZ5477624.1 flavodoxin [Bacillus sp. T_4]MDH6652107.1 flavodoxin I [Bacillus sp. PvP124]MDP9577804.1 flavodoxin I [Bacillus sp. 1751]MEB2273577.1 flavodoxin [Bacillus sp. ILBB4]